MYKAARVVSKLERLRLDEGRTLKGGLPTLNVGWFHGGMNVNSVPDEATFGLDIRMVPGLTDTDVHGDARRDRRHGCELHQIHLISARFIPSHPTRGSRRCAR